MQPRKARSSSMVIRDSLAARAKSIQSTIEQQTLVLNQVKAKIAEVEEKILREAEIVETTVLGSDRNPPLWPRVPQSQVEGDDRPPVVPLGTRVPPSQGARESEMDELDARSKELDDGKSQG